ncbi:hypothetical protein [Alistipes putredinis]|uniref:hypothetical protein n=1 Tax=Alistipes putredinis TaxID=28117 RepID=UPI004024F802
MIAGLGKNHELVKNYGISLEEVSQLEEVISEAEKLNEEVERLRSEISQTSMSANKRLIIIKDKVLEFKRIVKRHIDINRWNDLGVMDKR